MRGWTPLFLSPEQPCHSSPSQPWTEGGRFTSNKRLWRAACLSGADGRHSWDVLRQLSTSILQMLLEGEVEMLQPLETQTLCSCVCVFAIKIGAWLLAYMGTIMSWKKNKTPTLAYVMLTSAKSKLLFPSKDLFNGHCQLPASRPEACTVEICC